MTISGRQKRQLKFVIGSWKASGNVSKKVCIITVRDVPDKHCVSKKNCTLFIFAITLLILGRFG